MSLAVFPLGVSTRAAAQTATITTQKSTSQPAGAAASNSATPQSHRMRGTTNAQRKAAAAHLATRRTPTPAARPKLRSMAIVGFPGQSTANPLTLDQLYFSGIYPNYANSPLPNVADTVNCQAPNYCGIRKFVDTLPLLNTPNDLLNTLPVATPDTKTFPGSDYYEISLVQFRQQLHKDLPPELPMGKAEERCFADMCRPTARSEPRRFPTTWGRSSLPGPMFRCA